MKSRLIAPISAMALILAFSGLTAAQSATTQIKLCLYPVKGTVRLVANSATKCAKGEKLLTLGTQGPRGPEGPSGIPGESGPQGPRGLTGPQGPPGTNGTNGTNGSNGAVGPRGPQGEAGLRGLQGLPGPTGPSLVVLDANNALVGYLIDLHYSQVTGQADTFTLYVSSASRIVTFRLSGSVLTNVEVAFASNDCTGTAYLNDATVSAATAFPVQSDLSTVTWLQTDSLVSVADGETLTFVSTLADGTCTVLGNPITLTGPVTSTSWWTLASATSPLPTIVGPLHIGVQ